MVKYYLDTCIWIDYLCARKNLYKDFGEIAFKLLSKLLASDGVVIVSDFLFRELETACSLDEIRGLGVYFNRIIKKVCVSEDQLCFAKKLAEERNIPKGDAVHAIIARDCGAILVSRDKHFSLLADVCVVVAPEKII